METVVPRKEPLIPDRLLNFPATDDVSEDRVDGADQREADPFGGLPSKGRHYDPDESHVAWAVHEEQASALGAGQAPGVCEDDGIVLSAQVADDASAEGADEEIQAEGAKRGAASHHRGTLPEGCAALAGCGSHGRGISQHHAGSEDGEPAEKLSVSGQLLVLFASVKTPLVSFLEHGLESLLELRAVHQQEQLCGNIPVQGWLSSEATPSWAAAGRQADPDV